MLVDERAAVLQAMTSAITAYESRIGGSWELNYLSDESITIALQQIVAFKSPSRA